MEDGVNSKGKESDGDLAREEPDQSHHYVHVSPGLVINREDYKKLTKVLDILVSSKSDDTALLSGSCTCAVCLVDNDAVSDTCRQETETVGKGGPVGGEVECNVGQAISQRAEEQSNVTSKPSKLEGLGEGGKTLAQRQRCGRWRGHGGGKFGGFASSVVSCGVGSGRELERVSKAEVKDGC